MSQLSEALFEQYVGQAYPFSIVKYAHGTGKLIDGAEEVNAEWALCVGPDGSVRFFVVPMEPFLRSNLVMSFLGCTNDGMKIQAQRLKCTNMNIDTENPNLTTILHLLPESEITFQREGIKKLSLMQVHILNAAIEGEEYVERDGKAYPEKLNMKLGKYTVQFFLNQHHKQLIDFVRNGWLSAIAVSRFEISLQADESIQAALEYADNIGWLTSFICQQITAPPVTDFFDENGTLVYRRIQTVSTHRFHRGHLFQRRNPIVVSKVFEQLYESYTRDRYNLELRKVTGFLCAINETSFVELKLSTLIMAYEYLLSRYLLGIRAITPADLEKEGSNVKQKLTLANTHLKFIPAALQGETLRKVRNPLFHQGLLALNYPDTKQIFDEYRDLLLQITLRLLDYDGYYCPPGIGPPKNIKTGEFAKYE